MNFIALVIVGVMNISGFIENKHHTITGTSIEWVPLHCQSLCRGPNGFSEISLYNTDFEPIKFQDTLIWNP